MKKRFGEEDKEVMMDESVSNINCVKIIGAPYNSISSWRKRNNIKPIRHVIAYTKKDIEILKDLSLTNKECSKILNKTIKSIIQKRRTLKIVGYKAERKMFTDDDIKALNSKDLSHKVCAKLINRRYSVVYNYRKNNNLL